MSQRQTDIIITVSGAELLRTRFHVQHPNSASFDVPSQGPNTTYLQVADPDQLDAIAARLAYLSWQWRAELEQAERVRRVTS